MVVVRHPDGSEYIQRFTEVDEFRSWLVMWEDDLAAQRWTSKGGPIILPYGWPYPH